MHETIRSRDVADYFLARADEDEGDGLTNLKIQKLVYFAQGFHLAMQDEPLFGEPIEAWEYGPVVRSLYETFSHHKKRPIKPPLKFSAEDYPPEAREILDAVLVNYGQFTAWKLRDLTHAQRPWSTTPRDEVIAHEVLKPFFSEVVAAGREGMSYQGEPAWPTLAFKHQRRREIMRRAPDRATFLEALSRRSVGDD